MDNQGKSICSLDERKKEECYKTNFPNNSNDFINEIEVNSSYFLSEDEKIGKIISNVLGNNKSSNRNESSIQVLNEEIKEEESTKINSDLIIEIKNEFLNHYFFDYLLISILNILNISDEIKKKFIKTEQTKEIDKKMSDEYVNQKQKRKPKKPRMEEDKKQLGRKRKMENSDNNNANNGNYNYIIGYHSKYSTDNIFKNIKNKYLKYLVKFTNEYLNIVLENKIKKYYKNLNKNKDLIKYLDSKKIVENNKREYNINLLNTTLKDILSDEVSHKFSKKKKNSNKNIITKILENESNNKCIQFLFNLTFSEWIDIFIYKKDLTEYDSLIEEKINKVFETCKIENILEKIGKENDSDYFSCFLFLTYNFQRWIISRKGRAPNNNNKESEI